MTTKPTNIRIDARTDEKLNEAAEKSGFPKADIIRQAIALGLKDLEAIGFDIDRAVYAHVCEAKAASDAAISKGNAKGVLESNRHSTRQSGKTSLTS